MTNTSDKFDSEKDACTLPSSLSLLIVTGQTISKEQKQQLINQINSSKKLFYQFINFLLLSSCFELIFSLSQKAHKLTNWVRALKISGRGYFITVSLSFTTFHLNKKLIKIITIKFKNLHACDHLMAHLHVGYIVVGLSSKFMRLHMNWWKFA